MAATTAPEGEGLLKLCAQLLGDKHVDNLRAYDVRGVSPITDYYLVGSVRNERQMKAAGQNLTRQLKRQGIHAFHKDGELSGNSWVVLDYLDCIVHLFDTAARQRYNIEALWRTHEMEAGRLAARPHGRPATSVDEQAPGSL